MAKLILTWHTAHDERVCPICQALDGYTWTFDASRGQHLDKNLVHPKFGVVWTLDSGSKAHGHARFNCRCTLIPTFDMSDLRPRIEKLFSEIMAEVEQ